MTLVSFPLGSSTLRFDSEKFSVPLVWYCAWEGSSLYMYDYCMYAFICMCMDDIRIYAAAFVVCAVLEDALIIQHKHVVFPLLRYPRLGGCLSWFNHQHGMINFNFFERMGLFLSHQKRMKLGSWFLVGGFCISLAISL